MYSPKIKEELIPILYQMAKAKKTRMTTLVNEIIQKVLGEMKSADGQAKESVNVAACCAEMAGISKKGRKRMSGEQAQNKAFEHCPGSFCPGLEVCDSASERADGVRGRRNVQQRPSSRLQRRSRQPYRAS